MKRSSQPFVVGRRTARGTTVVVLRRLRPAPPALRGPWTVRAVVAPLADR